MVLTNGCHDMFKVSEKCTVRGHLCIVWCFLWLWWSNWCSCPH